MKSVSVLAFAASASATVSCPPPLNTIRLGCSRCTDTAGQWNWNDAGGYNCPGNTNNQCNSQQSSGFTWGDLDSGSFSSYGGFDWSGFTCGEGYAKREPGSRFAPRTLKTISGSCGHDTTSSPSFGCSSSGGSSSSSYGSGSYGSGSDEDVSAFSVDTIDISTEFSCTLEFQYGMGDGSICKQRSACSSEGSTVKNSQCGGAKNVTIVYPSGQSGDTIPKESTTCSISIPTISFDCNSASSTVTRATQTHSYSTAYETSPGESTPTPTAPAGGYTTSSQYVPGYPSNTGSFPSAGQGTTTAFSFSTASTVVSYSVETPSSSVVVETPSSSVVVETPGSSVVVESSTTSNSPVTQSAPSSASSTSIASSTSVVPSSAVSTTYETSSTYVTSFIGTSTIYSTSYQTITSCASTVTDCPAGSGSEATTTVVVAVSTTICPVTETQTSVYTTSHAVTATQTGSTPAVDTSSPEQPSSSSTTEVSPVGATGSASAVVPAGSGSATTVTSAATSTQTLSYPTIVPACISTWNYIVGCVDNSDTSCYCPDSTFVSNVYDCLYAYGESDEEVSEAVQYFQGLCGSYAQGNPAVATGATVTTYLTASVSSTPLTHTPSLAVLRLPFTNAHYPLRPPSPTPSPPPSSSPPRPSCRAPTTRAPPSPPPPPPSPPPSP